MPPQASSWAERIDFINAWITYVSMFCTVAITGAAVYFAIKYRRRADNQQSTFITHNAVLETVWTVIPTIVVIWIFWYGIVLYKEMRTPPSNPIEVTVDGYKWRWEFQHANGKKATNELVVPLGKPVRLIMRSNDVLHSFYIPAMRVKEDLVGAFYTYLWFNPIKLGEFNIFCAEYCGLNHSAMRAQLKVVTPEQYQDYLLDRGATVENLPPEQLGEKTFKEKGCNACHSLTGTPGVGPSLKGVAGSKVALADGSSVEADENFLRESILHPNAKIVQGFAPNLMPVFEGQLTEDQIKGLIAYIKTVK